MWKASVAGGDVHTVRRGVGRRREPGGADPCCIPNTGFGGVELDVRVGKTGGAKRRCSRNAMPPG